MVKCVVENNANVHILDDDGRNLLHVVNKYSKRRSNLDSKVKKVLRVRLRNGAIIQDKNGLCAW